MRAFKYNGVDFSRWLKATPTVKAGHEMTVETSEVPGRPGAVPLGTQTQPKTVSFFCRLRVPWSGWEQTAWLRRKLAAALYAPDGAELVSPDEPGMRYKDAYMTSPGEWESMWASGSATIDFTCYDPVAYGARRSVPDASEAFAVGGTYPTWPTVTAKPTAGDGMRLVHVQSSDFIQLEHDFDGTEEVAVDCARQLVTIDGDSAMRYLTVTSDFFRLPPGENSFRLEGGGSVSCEWDERWL